MPLTLLILLMIIGIISRGCCTSINWWRDFVAAGFANGQISIYSPDRGQRLIDLNAHSKWINGIDIAPKTGLVRLLYLLLYLFLVSLYLFLDIKLF